MYATAGAAFLYGAGGWKRSTDAWRACTALEGRWLRSVVPQAPQREGAAAIQRWRDLLWWHNCQKVAGRHWQHCNSDWHQNLKGVMADVFGLEWQLAAVDREDWQRGETFFARVATTCWGPKRPCRTARRRTRVLPSSCPPPLLPSLSAPRRQFTRRNCPLSDEGTSQTSASLPRPSGRGLPEGENMMWHRIEI